MSIPISEQIWQAKYRFQNAAGKPEGSVEETFARVAKAAASAESAASRKAWERRFADAMSGFAFIPAGRVLAGAGTGRDVTLFNCFVMGEIGDDMGSIFANVREAALTLQQGGGIGHDFSTLRPKGAPVRGAGADASGPVSFMDVWDSMCRTIMSAGSRRGAMMGTLRCDHPDIKAFIEAKADPHRLRNFNLSVLVTDAFLAAVRAGAPWPLVFGGEVFRTVSAQGLWHKIMRSAYDYAEPGVIFIDRVNALNNLSYCETIHATNPCVTRDAWVHTSEGPRKVADLIGQPFLARVDGSDHASPRGFLFTGDKPVLHLETKEGYELTLTPDHPVRCVTKKSRHVLEFAWRAAGDLSPGDEILLNDHRQGAEWAGAYTFEQGYMMGLLMGDGVLKTDKAVLSVWADPASRLSTGANAVMAAALACAATLKRRADFRGWMAVPGRFEHRLSLAAIKALAEELGMSPGAKAITPQIEAASGLFYKGFLRGFFDCDGSVQSSHAKGVSVRLAQSDLGRLKAVQRMLLRLGVASKIYQDRRPAALSSMPNGRGGHSLYATGANHELIISGENLLRFKDVVGFADIAKSERLNGALSAYKRRLNRERFIVEVSSITQKEAEPVYDAQVPGLNAFDANGFYVHNCGEQPLPPYGACLLGSINLAALVEAPFSDKARLNESRLDELTPVAVRLLDNIIDISRYPLPAQEKEAKAKRRIGLGVTGLADALILCGKHYGSEEGRAAAQSWMRRIARAAYAASSALAEEKGSFPLFDADRHLQRPFIAALDAELKQAIRTKGVRNGLLTSIAPTGTISLLAGNVSSGVEPVFDFEYSRRILEPDGSARIETVQDYAVRLFRSLHPGAPLPEAFVTAGQLSPHEHLAMQAALQPHIDASISKTVNCPKDIAFDDFETLYLEAHRLGLKGCTAYRPNAITGAVLSQAPERESSGALKASQPALPLPAALKLDGAPPFAHPLPRDPVLAGFTYKIKWPGSDHALYVTINDTIEQGRRRPFEIFINSKNLEHYAWTVALTRMISAIFRRGGEVAFVVEELKAVFDPRGGAWMSGKYVPSPIAAIGDVIEQHFKHIGFLENPGAGGANNPELPKAGDDEASGILSQGGTVLPAPSSFCSRCGSPGVIFQEGCLLCRNCGYSSCG